MVIISRKLKHQVTRKICWFYVYLMYFLRHKLLFIHSIRRKYNSLMLLKKVKTSLYEL